MDADGNCFFRAVSYAVCGTQRNHRKFRLAVVKYMEQNKPECAPYLRQHYTSVDEYIAKSEMRRVDRWATEVEIQMKFDQMCIATFVSEYRVLSASEKSPNKIKLNDDSGYVLRRTRTAPAVVRYARFSATKDAELYHQSMLQLFLPYRNINHLKPPGYDKFEDFYNNGHVSYADGKLQSVKGVVDQNRLKFEIDADLLQSAEEAVNNGILEDAWGQLCPEQEMERLQCQEEQIDRAELLQDPNDDIPDLADNSKQNLHIERQIHRLSRTEGLNLIRSLNDTQ